VAKTTNAPARPLACICSSTCLCVDVYLTSPAQNGF
jgi:hypothetical protein